MSVVIDASAIVPLALSDEDRSYAETVLRYIAKAGNCFAPPIFMDELQNVLLYAERQNRIEQQVSDRFITRVLEELPIEPGDAPDRVAVMALARRTGLSFYDATYLALARRMNAPIATLDKKLSKAAAQEGVSVLS
jgi:predicted nucleic acid-binding protein